MNQGDFSRSRDALDRALKIAEKKYGSEHPATADFYYALGSVCSVEMNYDDVCFLGLFGNLSGNLDFLVFGHFRRNTAATIPPPPISNALWVPCARLR
jgi:hypothetical protein